MYVSFRFRAKLAILGATTSSARVKNYIKVSCVQTTTKFVRLCLLLNHAFFGTLQEQPCISRAQGKQI